MTYDFVIDDHDHENDVVIGENFFHLANWQLAIVRKIIS